MMTMNARRSAVLVRLASRLSAAYVSRNHVPVTQVPGMIASIGAALDRLVQSHPAQAADPQRQSPYRRQSCAASAEIHRSITQTVLISFIDGKPYKMLKRHLTAHGLSPDSYRLQYGLPADYPMVAPSYSELRGVLARSMGLGSRLGGRRNARSKRAMPAALPDR